IGRGKTVAPERVRIEMPESEAVLLEMPSYIMPSHIIPSHIIPSHIKGNEPQDSGLLGTKIVSVFARNASRGLDTVQSLYVLLSASDGRALPLMDGRFITAIRTAATSGVATRLMAGPGNKVLAIFGAGVQARSHAEAMTESAAVDRIFIVARDRER